MLNVSDLLEQLKQTPYRMIEVATRHTGVVTFEALRQGDSVHGPEGTWKEKPGTKLATLTRERNPKPIYAPEKGVIETIHTELENQFVECGTPLVTIRHYLTREEVESIILREASRMTTRPETLSRSRHLLRTRSVIRMKPPNSHLLRHIMQTVDIPLPTLLLIIMVILTLCGISAQDLKTVFAKP